MHFFVAFSAIPTIILPAEADCEPSMCYVCGLLCLILMEARPYMLGRERKMKPSRLAFLILAAIFLAVGCKKKPTEAETSLHWALETPLHLAAKAGDTEKVRTLIENGADVNAKGSSADYTPLHEAALAGHKAVAELLIANGASVNARGLWGRTPLHEAILWDRKDLIKLLVARGADVNAKDRHGRIPLHCGAGEGQEDVVELLINSS